MEIAEVRVFPVHEEKLKAFVERAVRFHARQALNSETRQMIEEQIISRYKVVVAGESGESTALLREPGGALAPHFRGSEKGDPTWP